MDLIQNLFLRLQLCFHFYKSLLFISITLSLVLHFLGSPLEAILLTKILLITFLFLYQSFISSKDQLLFYKNFRITTISLFVFCTFYDLLLSILIFKTIRLL